MEAEAESDDAIRARRQVRISLSMRFLSFSSVHSLPCRR